MQDKDFQYWICTLGNLNTHFQSDPSDESQLNLTNTMREYQEAVRNGLACSHLPIGEPWRRASTMKEWLELQLSVLMTEFKNKPTEERYEAVVLIMKEYRNAVFTGKVRP